MVDSSWPQNASHVGLTPSKPPSFEPSSVTRILATMMTIVARQNKPPTLAFWANGIWSFQIKPRGRIMTAR